MRRFYHKIAQKPLIVLIFIIFFTTVFVLAIANNARVETDLDKYMPQDHPAFVFSDKAEEEFEIKDSVLIAIENTDSIYNTGTLLKIKQISQELPKQFEVVEKGDITSLYTAENITAGEVGLKVEAFFQNPPESKDKLRKLREAVEGNKMVHGRVVSTEGKSTLIIIEVGDKEFSTDFYNKLQNFVKKWEGPENIRIAGRPVVEGELTKLGPKDMSRMAPLVLAVIVLIVFFLLRSVRDTLLNALIVLSGVLTAFGLMALLNVPIYTVSTMIPVMLIAIGVADGIHLHNSIGHIVYENPDITRRDLIKETLKVMVPPIQMTSITTAVGFLALLTSAVLPVRYFGFFTAVGIMMEMLMSLIIFPGSIYLFGPPKINKKHFGFRKDKCKHRTSFSNRYTTGLLKHSGVVILIAVIIVAASAYGATKVWIDTSFLSNFEDDSRIVKTDKFINKNFGGTSTLNVIFSSREEDKFKSPEVLKIIFNLQKQIKKKPVVGDSFGLTDYIARMNQVMHANSPEYHRIPDKQNMIAQYLLLYEMSGDPDNLNKVVDYDYKKANLTFQLKSDSSAKMESIIDNIEVNIPRFKELGIKINYAGSGYKSLVFANLLLEGQIYSLLFSFGLIALLLSLMFRNALIGLAGTIPIAITAVVNFGVMGLLGIPLSSATAIISAIAIGIGVDYAIHLIERYRLNRSSGMPVALSAFKTLSHTGRAIVYNAIAVIGGFSVLLVSVFPPNRQVGALVALNMATSAVGTMTILLLILVFMDRRALIHKKQNNNLKEGKNV